MGRNEYNEVPVCSCKHCMSLHVIVDDNDNDICYSCGSVNETDVWKNIDIYLEKKEIRMGKVKV